MDQKLTPAISENVAENEAEDPLQGAEELFGLFRDAVYMANDMRMRFEHNVNSPEESRKLVGEEKTGETPNIGIDLLSSFRSYGWISDAW